MVEQLNKRKIHCEGLESNIISLKIDLENSNEQKNDLLRIFEEQENWLKEEIIKLKTKVEEERKLEEVISNQLNEKWNDCEKLKIEVVSLRSKLGQKHK